MAATAKMYRLRLKALPITTTHNPASLRSFSSSSSSSSSATPGSNSNSSPEPPPQSQSPSSYSESLRSIRAGLRQPPPVQQQEILKNLAEFRRRTVAPPPASPNASGSTPVPPNSRQPISFEKLLRNSTSEGEGPTPGESMTFQTIRQSLKRNTPPTHAKNQNNRSERFNERTSRPNVGLNLKLSRSVTPSSSVIGGNDATLPVSVFGREIRAEKDNANGDDRDESDDGTRTDFYKSYEHNHNELGEKLRSLRPEKEGNKKELFSLEELNQRLVKLRQMDKIESKTRNNSGFGFSVLRGNLEKLAEQKTKNNTTFRLDRLGLNARTPLYMLSPPKEDLVEKYFHPDNMSASEKLKIELNNVRDEFKMSESDCGSARVQVAQLTTKIKHLSEVLHPKDKHSKKGLRAMVERRKKLLKYMRRTDWDSYCLLLSKLGLRDNPGYKH